MASLIPNPSLPQKFPSHPLFPFQKPSILFFLFLPSLSLPCRRYGKSSNGFSRDSNPGPCSGQNGYAVGLCGLVYTFPSLRASRLVHLQVKDPSHFSHLDLSLQYREESNLFSCTFSSFSGPSAQVFLSYDVNLFPPLRTRLPSCKPPPPFSPKEVLSIRVGLKPFLFLFPLF